MTFRIKVIVVSTIWPCYTINFNGFYYPFACFSSIFASLLLLLHSIFGLLILIWFSSWRHKCVYRRIRQAPAQSHYYVNWGDSKHFCQYKQLYYGYNRASNDNRSTFCGNGFITLKPFFQTAIQRIIKMVLIKPSVFSFSLQHIKNNLLKYQQFENENGFYFNFFGGLSFILTII